jgi:hypothetical protein
VAAQLVTSRVVLSSIELASYLYLVSKEQMEQVRLNYVQSFFAMIHRRLMAAGTEQ